MTTVQCDVGSPPPEVELEVEGGNPPPYQQEDKKESAMDVSEEKEAVDGGGLFDPQPPVGILKSNSYVSGDESEAEQVRPTTDDPKQQGKKERRAGRKLVPVWRLVSRIFNNFNGKHIIHIYLCSFDLLICGTL